VSEPTAAQQQKELERQAFEYKRCTDEFSYFVSTYCYIEDRKSKRAILFDLWPGQREVAPLFLTIKHLILLKARQLGLTWLTAAYVVWRAIFHFHEFIVIISAKEDLAVEFLDRVKFIFDRLPHWIKPHVGKRTTTELFLVRRGKMSMGMYALLVLIVLSSLYLQHRMLGNPRPSAYWSWMRVRLIGTAEKFGQLPSRLWSTLKGKQ